MPVVRSLSNVVRAAETPQNQTLLQGNTGGTVRNATATFSGAGSLVLNHDTDSAAGVTLLLNRGRVTGGCQDNDYSRIGLRMENAAGTFQDAMQIQTTLTDATNRKTRTDFNLFDTTTRQPLSLIADGAAGIRFFDNLTIRRVSYGSQVQDVPSIAATAVATFTMSVPGAALGDLVMVSADVNLDNNLLLLGKVSAADTVTVQLHNTNTLSPINPPSATYRAIAIGV